MSPARNAVRASPLACGRIATSPPPASSVSKPLSASQARSATSWVLPSCGVASVLPFRSLGVVDPVLHDEERPARGRAGHDPDGGAVRLGVRVDGRVGPDEAGIELLGEQRRDRLRPGVEGRRLRRVPGRRGVLEEPAEHPHDRRRMRDVREVPEPHLSGRFRAGGSIRVVSSLSSSEPQPRLRPAEQRRAGRQGARRGVGAWAESVLEIPTGQVKIPGTVVLPQLELAILSAKEPGPPASAADNRSLRQVVPGRRGGRRRGASSRASAQVLLPWAAARSRSTSSMAASST